MWYNAAHSNIDLTKFEGKIIIEVDSRNEIIDVDPWSISSHHGKEGVWYMNDHSNFPIELEPFKISDDGTKFYEIHVNPSVLKNQLKRHTWIVQYWDPKVIPKVGSTLITIIEYHDRPWDLIINGMTIKGIPLNENVISSIHNS